jgi:hypothetical protein
LKKSDSNARRFQIFFCLPCGGCPSYQLPYRRWYPGVTFFSDLCLKSILNKEKEEIVTTTDTAAMRKGLASMQDSTDQPDDRAFLNNIQLTAEQHILTISLQGQRYIINLDRHVGTKGTVLLFGGSFKENMKQTGFVFVRSDTLLGKPCRVWEQPNGLAMPRPGGS